LAEHRWCAQNSGHESNFEGQLTISEMKRALEP
jgi:hypothetical protein